MAQVHKGYSRVQWGPEDQLRVAVHALPYLDNGLSEIDALEKAQAKALPKALRVDRNRLSKRLWNSRTRPEAAGILQFIEKARAMSPEERDAIRGATIAPATKPEPAPRAAPAPAPADAPSKVYWVKSEWARVAKAVKAAQDAGDTRSLPQLYAECNLAVLPRERWRPSANGFYRAASDGTLQKFHEQGLADAWLLPPDPEPVAEAPAPEPTKTASEPLPAIVATVAPPMPFAPVGEALAAFGATLSQAVGVLLQAQAQATIQTLDAKLSEIAQHVGASIAEQIERGLRQTVLDTIAQELGGPVAAPAPAPAPAAEVEAESVKRLKVDVVGVPPGASEMIAKIKSAFNGHTDLRIIDADTYGNYAPHRGRHCIFLINSAPHGLKDKVRAAGVKPLWVKATAGHVIHAIEELHRSAGVPK